MSYCRRNAHRVGRGRGGGEESATRLLCGKRNELFGLWVRIRLLQQSAGGQGNELHSFGLVYVPLRTKYCCTMLCFEMVILSRVLPLFCLLIYERKNTPRTATPSRFVSEARGTSR